MRKGLSIIVSFLIVLILVGSVFGQDNKELFKAIANEDVKMVEFLLKADVDLNAKGKDGCTPLTKAIEVQNVQIVDLLIAGTTGTIKVVANVNQANCVSHLALAIRLENAEIVKSLLGVYPERAVNVANPFKKDNWGFTPLVLAVQRENHEIANLLIEASENSTFGNGIAELINAYDSFGSNPIGVAVENDDVEMVKLLISKNVNINAQDNDYYPLWVAVDHENVQIVTQLLEAYAGAEGAVDVNAECTAVLGYNRTRLDFTPLRLAVEKQNVEIIKLLLKNNADPNFGTELPLHRAVYLNNAEIVDLLLNWVNAKIKANVNAIDYGETPLQIAVGKKFMEVATILIDANARMVAAYDDTVDQDNTTATKETPSGEGKDAETPDTTAGDGE